MTQKRTVARMSHPRGRYLGGSYTQRWIRVLTLTAIACGGGDTPTSTDPDPSPPGEITLSITTSIELPDTIWPDSTISVVGTSQVTAAQRNGTPNATIDSTVVSGVVGQAAVRVKLVGSPWHFAATPGAGDTITLTATAYATASGSGGRTARGNTMATVQRVALAETSITGVVWNSLTDEGAPARITVFILPDTVTAASVIDAGGDGTFSTQLPHHPDEIMLTAVLTDGNGVAVSFLLREPSIELRRGRDNPLGVLQVFPADWLTEAGLSMEGWRTFMNEVAFDANLGAFGHNQSLVLHPDSVLGIYVNREDVLGRGRWSESEQAIVRDDIISRLASLYPQSSWASLVIQGDSTNLSLAYDSTNAVRRGWYVVLPDTTMVRSGITTPVDQDADGFIERGSIDLNSGRALSYGMKAYRWVRVHELYHLLGLIGHPSVVGPQQSIMAGSSQTVERDGARLDPSVLDDNALRLLLDFSGRKRLEDILGIPSPANELPERGGA